MAGQKIKGGMWCQRCGPVAAVKNTHGVRNAAGVGGAFMTAGLSLLIAKREFYVCPNCGGPVRGAWRAPGQAPTGAASSAATIRLRAASGKQLYEVKCPICKGPFETPKGQNRCPHCGYSVHVDPKYWKAVE